MSELWETYYLNDATLKDLCETPKDMRLPIGSCVHVRKGHGYLFRDKWYRALPSYVIPDNIPRLEDICGRYNGWELDYDKPLNESDWRRGWVDEFYPLSSSPVFKCVVPGMVRVQLKLINKDLAKVSLDTYKSMPVCPTCTLEQYEDKAHRAVFDQAMRYFIHFWLYGGTYGSTDREEDT